MEEDTKNEEVLQARESATIEVAERELRDVATEQLVKASAETEKWEGRRLLSAEKKRNTGFQIERIQEDLANNGKQTKSH